MTLGEMTSGRLGRKPESSLKTVLKLACSREKATARRARITKRALKEEGDSPSHCAHVRLSDKRKRSRIKVSISLTQSKDSGLNLLSVDRCWVRGGEERGRCIVVQLLILIQVFIATSGYS